MLEKLGKQWRRLRKNYWLSLALDAGLLVVVFLLVSDWQSQEWLPYDAVTAAPDFGLVDLDGQFHSLQQTRGRETLIYFFSTDSHVCNLSAHNLEALRQARTEDQLAIYLVAIGWQKSDEVRAFVQRHKLSMPVLLGDGKVIRDYRVLVTPTYYVLDSEGRVRQRSVGYSSERGLRWRT